MDENNSENEVNNELEEQDIQERNEINDNIQKVEINNEKEVIKTVKNTEKVKYVHKDEKNKEKRGNDNKIYVQYRKPSVFSSILLILIGVMIATIALLLLYIYKGKKEVVVYKEPEDVVQNTDKQEENIEKPEVKELDLNLEGEFVQNLHKKIPMGLLAQEEIYSYRKTTESNLTGLEKMLFVLNNMRKSKQYQTVSAIEVIDRLDQKRIYNTDGSKITEVEKFNVIAVEAYFKSVFGSNKNIVKEDIDTNFGYMYEYDEQDKCFYGHSYAGGGGASIYWTNMIDSVQKNEDSTEIYIYDYFMKLEGDHTTKVYTYSVQSNVIGQEDEPYYEYYDKDDSEIRQLFEKYKNNGLVKFRHTYKLDKNGDYYWYSCEPIK